MTNSAITTPVLSQNDNFVGRIALGSVFVLLRLATSAPARVRLYSSYAAQQGDLGRSVDTPVTPGASIGLIADFNLSASEANWICSPAVTGFNAETPQSNLIYVTVTNTQATSTKIAVSFGFLTLEN